MVAPAPENEMRMCIHESRSYKPALGVDKLCVCRVLRKLSVCSDLRYHAVIIDKDCGIMERGYILLLASAACSAAVRSCKGSDVLYQKHGLRHPFTEFGPNQPAITADSSQ